MIRRRPCLGSPLLQVLLTYQGQKLGMLEVESKWVPNKARETKLAYGTSALEHPGEVLPSQQPSVQTARTCKAIAYTLHRWHWLKNPWPSVCAPGVKMVAWERGRYYLGGRVHGFELPKR